MNVDTTPGLEKRFHELEERVANYTGNGFPTLGRSLGKVEKIYIIIPLVIAAILAVMKPQFLYIQSLDRQTRYFSYKKYITAWLMLSTAACIGYYAYKYKKM